MNMERLTGQVHRPDRFADLKPEVQAFLVDMDADDIRLIREGIKWAAWTKTTGRVMRFMILLSFGAFVGMATFGDALSNLWHKLAGVPRP